MTKEQLTKTVKVLMNIPQPYYNHYGGMIAFGPDRKLYIGKGDAGWEGDPLNAGQNLNVLWGKLLRIDVDTDDDTPYAVPKDNPFAKADKPQLMSLFGITEQGFTANKIGSRPEIWTYGLRNPYMFYFDQKSGDLFIADAGQNHWEEINYQPASSKGGENYGWKFNEGSYCHPAMSTEKCARSSGFCPLPNILIQRRSRTERKPTMALLVAGAWRRQLWRPDQDLSGWRRVFGPPVWRGLGR